MLLDPALFAAYLVAAAALVVSPGPDTMFVLASSASGGARSGIAATLGITTGGLVHTMFAALGISALIAASPTAFEVLRIAGAIYLLWLGLESLTAFWHGLKNKAPLEQADGERSFWNAYRRGFMSNVLNPKVAVFFVAFLPQFTNPALGHVPLQLFLLGLVPNALGVLWLGGLSFLSGRAAEAFARNRRVRAWLDGVAGMVYVALALRIFVLDRRPA